jgi:hypothetical protein
METVVDYANYYADSFLEGSEKNDEKPRSGLLVPWPAYHLQREERYRYANPLRISFSLALNVPVSFG